jgi:hypothetical protein
MTARNDPLQQLTVTLRERSNSQAGRRALQRFRGSGIRVGRSRSLLELVARYHEGAPRRELGARNLLEALLGLAPSDPDAALCALVALRPALYWVAARVYGAHPSEDDFAELMAFAWESICAPPATGSRARHVVLLTRTRARTARRRRGEQPAPLDIAVHGLRIVDLGADPAERDEPLLERAVRAGVLSRKDAELIALTRGIGVPIKVLTYEFDLSPKALFARRNRAESALREALKTDLRCR